jgi:putative transcriptional regulator
MIMKKKMSPLAQGIIAGLEDAIAHVGGKTTKARTTTYVFADAKAIREQLGMSQSSFSTTYNIPLDTLQNWEQGRSNPDRTASAYLWAIAELPKQISKAQSRHRGSTQSNETVTT